MCSGNTPQRKTPSFEQAQAGLFADADKKPKGKGDNETAIGKGALGAPCPQTCARRLRLLDLTGRTRLDTITSNLRLKLRCCKESFRAEEKPKACRKISKLIFRSVLRLFAVRLRTARAALPRCPEAVDCDFAFLCIRNFYGDKGCPFWFSFRR